MSRTAMAMRSAHAQTEGPRRAAQAEAESQRELMARLASLATDMSLITARLDASLEQSETTIRDASEDAAKRLAPAVDRIEQAVRAIPRPTPRRWWTIPVATTIGVLIGATMLTGWLILHRPSLTWVAQQHQTIHDR